MGCVSSTPSPTSPPVRSKSKSATASRENAWKITGIVSLRDSNAKEIPTKLLDADGDFALKVRNLDAANNKLSTIPREIGNCTNITRLVLSNNALEALPGEIGRLVKLKILICDDNRLKTLPVEIASCRALTALSVKGNDLDSIPSEISQCAALVNVNFRMNRNLGTSVLDVLAGCVKLEEIDVSSCAITLVPARLGNLKSLKVLAVDDNACVETIPSALFKSCTALTKLSAHGTSIRNVEYIDGYDAYVERVKARHGKIISGDVMIVGDRGLDYGFDYKT